MLYRDKQHMIFWVLLLGTLGLVLFIGLGLFNPPVVVAAISHLKEVPGQMVYQSRQKLKDQQGNTWQAIAFKRIRPDKSSSFYLRLVSFPGVAQIDRSQPLTLTDSLGKTFTAIDASSDIFTESATPEPNVGQYDLGSLLPQLQAAIPLELTLPTLDGKTFSLSVPSALIEEWRTISSDE